MNIDGSASLCSLPRSIVPVRLLFLSSPPSVSFERSDGSNTKGIWPPHIWENYFYSDEWCISPSHPELPLLKVRPQDKPCGQRHQRQRFCGWCLDDPTIIRWPWLDMFVRFQWGWDSWDHPSYPVYQGILQFHVGPKSPQPMTSFCRMGHWENIGIRATISNSTTESFYSKLDWG